jgi:hypothetical protein
MKIKNIKWKYNIINNNQKKSNLKMIKKKIAPKIKIKNKKMENM